MDDDKIYDAMGNELHSGDFVSMNPPQGQLWIGKVTHVEPGLVSRLQKGNIKPGTVRLIFDITLQLNPNMRLLKDIVRVVDPRSEQIIKKILEEPSQTPPADGSVM